MAGSLALIRVVRALHDGAVIAYPTEGVWGLGCDPDNQKAVSTLLALKHRPIEKGLILVAADAIMFAPLIDTLPADKRRLLQQSWPGPNTWVVPDPDHRIPSWIRGRHDSVALRVSAHPVVQQLSRAFGGALVSTSANPAGLPAALNQYAVRRYFGELVMMVRGETGADKVPTAIRDLVTGKILRAR